MAQLRITAVPMDTEEEVGAVSTLGSLASGGDTAVYSPGEINWPGSILWAWDLVVGIRREFRKDAVEGAGEHPDSPVQILNLVD